MIIFQQTCITSFDAHPKALISALGVLQSSRGSSLDDCFFTGGSDGTVKLWRLQLGEVEEQQTLELKGKLPLDLAVAYLPGSDGKSRFPQFDSELNIPSTHTGYRMY